MATCFDHLNGKKLVIGLVHLLPMPGTPLYEDGNLDKMTRNSAACADLIEEDLGAELEGGEELAGAVALYGALIDGDINHVAVRE